MLDALVQALYERRPAGALIHHSDRGSQYLSNRYTERPAEAEEKFYEQCNEFDEVT